VKVSSFKVYPHLERKRKFFSRDTFVFFLTRLNAKKSKRLKSDIMLARALPSGFAVPF